MTGFLRISKFSGLFVGLAGAIVLIGWALDIPQLKSISPEWVSMKANTAFCFLIAGSALYIETVSDSKKNHYFKYFAAFIIFTVGLATFLEHLLNTDFNIDQLLFRDDSNPVHTSSPGRMAPQTALSFMILGVSLFLSDQRLSVLHRKFASNLGQWLALSLAFIGTLSLCGYLYEVNSLYGIQRFTQIAFHTSLGFIILSIGLLCLNPAVGIMEPIQSDKIGGTLARRTLPALPLIIIGMGWLRLQGQKAGYYNTEFGLALMTVLTLSIITAFIWWNSNIINKIDSELRKQGDVLKLVLDNMNDGIAVSDENGKLVLFNPAAENILGLGVTASESSEWSKEYGVFHSDEITPFPATELPLVLAKQGKVTNNIEQFIRNAKRPQGVHISVNASPMHNTNGNVIGGVAVFRDVTNLKMMQEELKRSNKELESFSYSVAHDLRAPLRSMIGFSNILLEDHGEVLNDDAKSNVLRVITAAKKMGLLIDGLLDLSRLTRKELSKQAVDLSLIAKNILIELQTSEPEKKASFVVKDGVTVQGDPLLLKLALTNLIGNAWKYSSKVPDGIKIEFGMTSLQGIPTCFVKDNGVGFDMKYSDKLFGVFQRLHSTQEFDGIGIGLATVQRIIHRHGGMIWANAEPEKGATFYFTI